MIHKVSTCGCSGMLNACLLMLENPTLSYFCLLLAAGSNGRFLVFSLLSALVLFAFSVPPPFLQHWHRKGRAESQNNPASSSVLQTEFMSCTGLLPQGKKNTYKKQSNFSKQSKHAAHDWLHLAQEKICPSSRPSAPTEIPTSLSAQGHQTVLGLTHFS